MRISHTAISRPILTSMVFLAIITVGLISFSRLSIDLMPEINYPTISVITTYGNVAPEEMEELVTRPIEEALAAVQGVQQVSSTSTEGQSVVRVLFNWGTDLDAAANDIRDRIDRVLPRLPEDVNRPMIRKFDVSAFPIMIIGVSSDLNPLDTRRLVEDQIKYRLERVPGVAAADVSGGLVREIHVNLKADKLKALNLSPSTVLLALQRENRNIPAGLYERGNLEVLVRTAGEFTSLDEIRNTAVAVRNGAIVTVGDVATVEDSWQEVRQFIRVNGKPGLRVAIFKQSGSNTVAVAKQVLAELERLRRDFPQLTMVPIIDQSRYIQQSINNLGNSAFLGALLAILVLLIFLRNISSTAVIATAIPISVVATFALMYLAGLTLNIMTFGALALGIGMMVDSAIVVLENIYRHRESGSSIYESARVGVDEVSSAIIASTLTTVVVFLPVVFIRGVSGLMFRQMAYVVSFALLCSLVVALTLVPMLSTKLLRTVASESHRSTLLRRLYARSEASFKNIEAGYGRLLGWALAHRRTVIVAAAGLFVLSLGLVRLIGVQLMPQADESEVRVTLEAAVGTRPEVVNQMALAVEKIVQERVPEMTAMFTSVGGGGFRSAGGHTGEIRVTLVPKSQRKRSSEQVANDLRRELAGLPGVTIRTRAGQGLFLLRMGTTQGDQISVDVRGYDLETSRRLAQEVRQAISRVKGITDTQISREEGSPEEIIRIDRAKAADLGLSVSAIGEALQTALGGTYASYYREAGKEYRILVRLSEEDRKDISDLMDLTVVNSRGQPVVLRNVVQSVPRTGPVRIERKDQERVVTISANFTGRDMGSVVRDIRKELRNIPVPRDFAIQFGEEYEEQQRAFRELMVGFVLALLLIYMVMAGQFESLRDPFVVLFSIPMALIGVTLSLLLTGTIFTMQAFIGCIMLAGIVVNNAILLVDYTNQLRRLHGYELREAIRVAGSRRLRPILMTALTTILGLLPLSLGLGEGGEAQAPLARVVIGGLASSTLVTLVLVPVVYSLFEERAAWSEAFADLQELVRRFGVRLNLAREAR
ncbi:MAG: efflux RND transporter permease subunit [candidate division KSB1 bacterium]|nr:efflux RND transporter permease subunit [candidate division KSB1 bacterium]